MGRTQAEGMAGAVDEGALSLDNALHYHLTVNHYPPIGEVLGSAKQALALANQGDFDSMVDLPDGVSHRRFGNQAPVHECIEAWHLDAFIQEGGE